MLTALRERETTDVDSSSDQSSTISAFQYDAIDKDGIPRVWGVGETQEEAKEQCELALQEYCEEKKRNPYLYEIIKR